MNQKGFLPVMWLGTMSFYYAPQNISFDQEATVAIHPIIGRHEQTEPMGFTSQKIAFNGFFYSLNNSALAWLQNFTNRTLPGTFSGSRPYFTNIPISIGFFTQDNSNVLTSSSVWYSNVGYLTSWHFEYKGGYMGYKYPFRFTWIEAQPMTVVAAKASSMPKGESGDGKTFKFTMSSLPSGFIGGIQLSGSAITTNGLAQSITSIKDNKGNMVGSAPILGIPPGLFAYGVNPQTLSASSTYTFALDWPVQDNYSRVSIQCESYAQSLIDGDPLGYPVCHGDFTVTFATPFINNFTAVSLLYYAV